MSKQSRYLELHPDTHREVYETFPEFDYRKPVGDPAVLCKMSNPQNRVGQQQRAFTTWWAIECCGPLDLGLDLGSHRGLTPYTIHVDVFGTGQVHPYYGGGRYVADVAHDATNLALFPPDAFPYIASNHSLEHMPVGNDDGVVRLLEGWLALLRRGGILAMVVPDNAYFDVMASDKDHKHAWSHSDFRPRVLDEVIRRTSAEVLEFDTFQNEFSFNVLLRRV